MKSYLLSIFFDRNRFIQCFVMLTMVICSVAQAQSLPSTTPSSRSFIEDQQSYTEQGYIGGSTRISGKVGFKNIISLPSNGTVKLDQDTKEIEWERKNMKSYDSLIVEAIARPENSDKFALGIEMNSVPGDYSLILSAPLTSLDFKGGSNLSVYFFHLPESTIGEYCLLVSSMNNYVYRQEIFIVPSAGQLELGVDAGMISLKLDDTLYSTELSVPAFVTGMDWIIDVEVGNKGSFSRFGKPDILDIMNINVTDITYINGIIHIPEINGIKDAVVGYRFAGSDKREILDIMNIDIMNISIPKRSGTMDIVLDHHHPSITDIRGYQRSSVRLITDSTEGLTLPTSKWGQYRWNY